MLNQTFLSGTLDFVFRKCEGKLYVIFKNVITELDSILSVHGVHGVVITFIQVNQAKGSISNTDLKENTPPAVDGQTVVRTCFIILCIKEGQGTYSHGQKY